MRLLLAPRWMRRTVTIPLTLAAFAWLLGLLPLWLVIAAFVSRFVPGRWRPFRLTWFAFVYLTLEIVVLAALFGLWIAAGFGRSLRSERSIDRHHRLMAWFLRRLLNTARFTFNITMDLRDDELNEARPDRPVLVLSRHAGAGDSFLLVDAVMNGARPHRARIVLKDLLQLDPAIDVMLNRVGASFVGGRDGSQVVAEIVRMASTATDRDAVVIFPEGGNFTEQRRERAITKLVAAGRTDLAERARRLEHLLPPKPRGALAAIEAAPTATVVFVGHAGLEALATPRDIWRNLPMDHVVSTQTWRVHAEDVPPPEAREAWLYDQWETIDRWVDETLVEHERQRERAAIAARSARRRPTARERLLGPVQPLVIAFGVLSWWESLRPTLLPRSPLTQGVISALSIVAGMCIGTAIRAAGHRVARLKGHAIPPLWRERLVSALMLGALPVLAIGSARWVGWQREQRRLVGLDGLSAWSVVPMLLVAGLLVVALVLLGRSVVHLVSKLDALLALRIPVAPARWATFGVVAVSVVIAWYAAVSTFGRWADQSFGAFDETTPAGATLPTSTLVSGGPGSLVDWDDLGFEGRAFTGTAPQAASFAPTARPVDTPMDPIRVYVGLDSASSVDERVALAVAELERTDAFRRSVLVVVTPTGTGSVNPAAVAAIEHLHSGDTAIVAVQYSFLPSWLTFVLDTDGPRVLGESLVDAVHDAWSRQPAADRARLVVFGEGIGSMGGEHAFAGDDIGTSVAAMSEMADGVLLVGPTRGNPVFAQLRHGRDAGSPTWRPTAATVPQVRVANSVEDIAPGDAGWPTPRVLYLHHPSDAVGTWAPANAWSPPGWSAHPAPPDVPRAARWFPIVTLIAETFDLANGSSAAPGHGRDYTNEFVDAWAAVAPPSGWTAADTDRLRARLLG